MDETMEKMLRALRLHALRERWDEYVRLARKARCSAVKLLIQIVEDEYLAKQDRAREFRLTRAQIPERYVMATYPFERQPKLDRKKVLAIYDSLDYMLERRNVMLLGRTGSGKTGLATAYLTRAIERGYRGRFVRFADLVAELYASIADHTQEKVLRRYAKYDCLLVDEVGYVDVEPVQAGLFFTLMQKRHKKRTTLVTSNLGFSDWGSFLRNPHLTAALVDRLTETSYVINMRDCDGLREPPPGERKPGPRKPGDRRKGRA
jgi:DNA replication protein DnaC